MSRTPHGTLHHVELWVPNLDRALASLGWLLEEKHALFQSWAGGRSWQLGPIYLVIEQSPSLTGEEHDRCRPGLNHVAFHIKDAFTVERMVTDAAQHVWRLMFPEKASLRRQQTALTQETTSNRGE